MVRPKLNPKNDVLIDRPGLVFSNPALYATSAATCCMLAFVLCSFKVDLTLIREFSSAKKLVWPTLGDIEMVVRKLGPSHSDCRGAIAA